MCPLLFYCTSEIVHVRTVWKFSNTWKTVFCLDLSWYTVPQYFLMPSSDISHYNSYNAKAWCGIYNRKGSFFPAIMWRYVRTFLWAPRLLSHKHDRDFYAEMRSSFFRAHYPRSPQTWIKNGRDKAQAKTPNCEEGKAYTMYVVRVRRDTRYVKLINF